MKISQAVVLYAFKKFLTGLPLFLLLLLLLLLLVFF